MSKITSVVLMLLVFGLVTAPAWAYSYVLEVKGSSVLSFGKGGTVSYMPVLRGTILYAGSTLTVSKGGRVSVACNSDIRLRKEVNKTTPVNEICASKKRKKSSAMRGEEDSDDYPMILNPRDSKVLAIKNIEWRHSGHGPYRLFVEEVEDDRRRVVDEKIEIAKGIKRDEIQTYSLKRYQDKILPSKSYEIRIEKVEDGKSSRSDPAFSGVVKIATQKELEEFKTYRGSLEKQLNSEAPINYYYAIYLADKGYYTDSNWSLGDVNISGLTEYVMYMRLANNKHQKVPKNILIMDWLRLLNQATKNENVAVASMVCDELRQDYSSLTMAWKNKISKLSEKTGFKNYCSL